MEQLRIATKNLTDHLIDYSLLDPKEIRYETTMLPDLALYATAAGLGLEEANRLIALPHPNTVTNRLAKEYFYACREYAKRTGYEYEVAHLRSVYSVLANIGKTSLNRSKAASNHKTHT